MSYCRFLKVTFEAIGVVLMCRLTLISPYLYRSVTQSLLSPATSFAEISPEVILRDEVKTDILFDIK